MLDTNFMLKLPLKDFMNFSHMYLCSYWTTQVMKILTMKRDFYDPIYRPDPWYECEKHTHLSKLKKWTKRHKVQQKARLYWSDGLQDWAPGGQGPTNWVQLAFYPLEYKIPPCTLIDCVRLGAETSETSSKCYCLLLGYLKKCAFGCPHLLFSLVAGKVPLDLSAFWQVHSLSQVYPSWSSWTLPSYLLFVRRLWISTFQC